MDNEIRLPGAAVRGHVLVLGQSGVGKSTLLQRVLVHWMEQRQELGALAGGVVVLDPNGDLVQHALRLVPAGLASGVRFLDFGCPDGVPALNLLDPALFPDRERCVDGLVRSLRLLWAHWGSRMEDVLKMTLSLLYEYNREAVLSRSEMLSFVDAGRFLEEARDGGGFPKHVLSRVRDGNLLQWADAFLRWDREARATVVAACGPLMAYRSDPRIAAVLGQSRSRVDMARVVDEGLVLLCSTSRGPMGWVVSALVGGALVEALEGLLRRRGKAGGLSGNGAGPGCILMCDDFPSVPGVDWERVVSDAGGLGCSVVLAGQTLRYLGFGQGDGGKLFVGRFGVLLGYRMMRGDAELVAAQSGRGSVDPRDLEGLEPHECLVMVRGEGWEYRPAVIKAVGPLVGVGGGGWDAVLDAPENWTVGVERGVGPVEGRMGD